MSKMMLTVPQNFLLDRSTTAGQTGKPSSLSGTVRNGTVVGGTSQSLAPVHDGPVAKTSQRSPKRRHPSVVRNILNSAK
jgi:hypothetical protein